MRNIPTRAACAVARAAALWLCWAALMGQAPAQGADDPAGETPAPQAATTILLINSYHPGYPWSDAESQGIVGTLTRARPDLHCFDEYLDTKRFPGATHLDDVARLIADKYARRPIRLVMTTDDAALHFALDRRPTLFPGVPIVFCGVNEYTSATLEGQSGVTGIGEMQDVAGTLDVILRLQPQTREVAILHDYSVTGMGSWHQALPVMPRYAARLKFRELPKLPLDGMVEELKKLTEGTVVLMLSYGIDGDGQALTPSKTGPALAKDCKVPIYTVLDTNLNDGTIGGNLLTGRAHGEYAAELALRILAGESPSAIPPNMTNTSRPWFNYQQLKRFGLSVSNLPPGSKLIHQPTTFVENHPTLIMSVSVFLAGLILTVVLLAIDISKRRRVEQALRVSEECFQKAFRSSPLTMIISTPYEGRLLDVSNRFFDMLGYTREEAVGRTVVDLGIWARPEDRASYVSDLMARGSVVLRDALWRRKDGRIINVVCSADLIEIDGQDRILSTVIDVTERRQIEAALRLTSTALDQASDCAYVSLKNGSFVYVNDTICRTLGHTREDFLERLRVWDVVGGLSVENWPDRWACLEVLGTDIAERQFLTKNGQEVPMEVNLRMLEFDGKPCAFALGRSLADRKKMEEERKKIDRQIQQSQKLESLGILAGGIAHDFNNLLTGVLGNADLALMELSPVAPARQYVEQIETGARRAAELTRQMLAYSGRGHFDVRTIQLSDVVAEMAHLLEVSISKKCVLKYHFATNLPPINADAAQLRQVIMNLIINASEAIGDRSGVIAVTTGAMECDGAYLSESYLDDNLEPGLYVYLEVADTGSGMTREVRQRIFDPFFTTKFTGRGLGLAAVLGIVRGHRGLIKVYSEPGRGSTFKVLLPPSQEPLPENHTGLARPPALHGSGLILLVDDEETIRSLVRTYLTEAGFEVLAASDGREAVEIFTRVAPRVRLVLLDLTMPHMNGEETYTELRRIRPDIRVILMSGYSEQDATSRFAGKRLAGFIQKPFRMEEFAAVIRPSLEEEAGSAPTGEADRPTAL